MKLPEAFALLGAGALGGIFSTVVAIASLVTYPVLLALGVPPLSANMTNTVALVLTGAGSIAGSRPELAGQRDRVLRLGVITALGGASGAAVLLIAPASTFTAVAPILIGCASVILLVQPRIAALAPRPEATDGGPREASATARPSASATPGTSASATPRTSGTPGTTASATPDADARRKARGTAHRVGVFAVAIYVGYFGAAAGVMLLVVLGMMIAEPLVRVNAIKNAVSGAANGMAAICFALFGSVRWLFVGPLAAGFLLGGWVGPKIARRVPATALRVVVSLCGVALALRLGLSAYR